MNTLFLNFFLNLYLYLYCCFVRFLFCYRQLNTKRDFIANKVAKPTKRLCTNQPPLSPKLALDR
ncbi:hypothetical protein BU24DRAFT_209144 [Aaosphaeria arxii CBS 175.79]|uniref:Uncharacterized protein n=1 Tax=Aaosphaeria arxii CBS 175.79 TaxID=1450172 RepID=A0A6A5XWU5_9PLEO|nr:uncharacterized protein BU24DRAFT_209144 [Aaosphaeria arxii CBS 175.79]KAF2016724.1 hypothetical protein BU24DRAFT_209144 [Aaosphaeria arxii CBS 175.79]